MKSQSENKGEKIPVNQPNSEFLFDINEIRKRAREHMENGPVTAEYKADKEKVISVLNDVLATEIVCTLRYKRHYFSAQGIYSKPIADEFLEHATEEGQHADMVARRIMQLGGAPDFNPDGLVTRSHSAYAEGNSLIDMIKEDLIAERVAVETYAEIIRWLGDNDPTSRRVMEQILEKEEEHADDLATLLEQMTGKK